MSIRDPDPLQRWSDAHGWLPHSCPCCDPPTPLRYHVGSIQEQMGMDGATKLAAAIQRLCDILETR